MSGSVSLINGHIDPDKNKMTVQDAIEHFTIALPHHKGTPIVEIYKLAISALEKQIPKIAIKNENYSYGRYTVALCPTCGSLLGLYSFAGKSYKHCCVCGQALDWSDTE